MYFNIKNKYVLNNYFFYKYRNTNLYFKSYICNEIKKSMEDKFIEGIAYVLPALVTGGVAYLILSKFIEINTNEKKIEALIEKKKESMPLRLQAYERLVLFSERLNPSKLLVRVSPIGEDAKAYMHLLIGNIEQEFEHNMVQQLYVSDEVWTAIIGTKLTIVNKIMEIAENVDTANQLRENLLDFYTKNESPTEIVVAIIKDEVKKML